MTLIRYVLAVGIGGLLALWLVVASSGASMQAIASPAPSQPIVGAQLEWDWPVDGLVVIVRGFDPPPQRWLPGHRGVDLAGRPDQVVRAAGAGVVAFAGMVAGRGVVSIDHNGAASGPHPCYESGPWRPHLVIGSS